MRAIVIVLVATSLAACFQRPSFSCTSTLQCGAGVCEPTGFCAFADLGCAAGLRYGDLSGPYANQCVGAGSGSDGGIVDAPLDASPNAFAIRINIAGPAHTGVDFPGAWATDPGAGGICNGMQFDSPTPTINGTNDSPLFANQMFGGTLTCTIPSVPSGMYQVTMLFAELRLGGAPCVCTGACPASRVFDIALEGTTVATGFDMTGAGGGCAASGGAGHATTRQFTVAITDGTLDVVETASTGAAALNAIELIKL